MGGLATLLKIALGLGAVLALAATWSSYMQLELLGRTEFSDAEADANDIREGAIGLAQIFTYVVTIVIFGVWIVRANKNVRALGAEGLRTTPGWALGFFFVPILSLWKPYQAMKDLWQASCNPPKWRGVLAGTVLPAWWMFWLVSNVLGQISFRAGMGAEDVDEWIYATWIMLGAQVLDLPLFLTAVILVSQITNHQEEYASKTNAWG